jgi:hypothetical protein
MGASRDQNPDPDPDPEDSDADPDASPAGGWADGRVRGRLGLAVGVVVVLFVVLAAAGFDWGLVLERALAARPGPLALAFVATLAAYGCWGVATARVLRTVEPALPVGRVTVSFLAGTFLKLVLPLGYAGGVPLMSYVYTTEFDVEYRPTLAATTASELVVFLGSVGVAVAGGVASLLVVDGGPAAVLGVVRETGVWRVLAAAALVSLALPVAAAALVRYWRRALRQVALGAATLGRVTLGRAVPRVDRLLAPAAVATTVESFADTFEGATSDRETVAGAAVLAVLGWLAFSLPLYLALLAVSAPIQPALAFLLVPAAGVATLLPIPGGLGSTEVGTTALLVFITPYPVEVLAAGVLLSRVASYWFVVAVGALASAYLTVGEDVVWRPGCEES